MSPVVGSSVRRMFWLVEALSSDGHSKISSLHLFHRTGGQTRVDEFWFCIKTVGRVGGRNRV